MLAGHAGKVAKRTEGLGSGQHVGVVIIAEEFAPGTVNPLF
jgi:hypothetical protein